METYVESELKRALRKEGYAPHQRQIDILVARVMQVLRNAGTAHLQGKPGQEAVARALPFGTSHYVKFIRTPYLLTPEQVAQLR